MNDVLEKIGEHPINTEYGLFHLLGFSYDKPEQIVLCLIKRSASERVPFVRVQYGCLHGSVFRSIDCDCGFQMDLALRLIAESGHGVFIYFPDHEGGGAGLKRKTRLIQYEIANRLTPKQAALDLGIGINDSNPLCTIPYLLASTGLGTKVRLLGNSAHKRGVLEQTGIEVVEVIPLMAPPELLSDIAIRERLDKG